MTRRITTLAGVAAAVVIGVATIRGQHAGRSARPRAVTPSGVVSPTAAPSPAVSPSPVPGPGADVLARVPAAAGQLVVVAGAGQDSSDSTLTVWDRTWEGSWQSLASWPAHNGRNGWSDQHLRGDLRSPTGVYTLTDAGGRKRDPGTRLPYHWDADFSAHGTGFEGEPLAGSFDYVIAIDYNRVPGSSPLDGRHPLGIARGGGIWLHVDHGGPTHGCVTLTEDRMVDLLRILDPAKHPVIVIGPQLS